MTTNIYLDESGFTGDDLYNPDQRFFTIASTVIQNDEAKDILARCFPRYQGSEYKFTNIWKRERSREGLLALAAEIPTIADRAFVWVIDKRFCLLTKMVDYLVEPGAYEAGYDWYANGWGMRYLNTIHRDLVRHGTDKLYDDIVRGWDDFARAPSEEKLEKLKQQLEYGKASTNVPLPGLFELVLRGLEHFRARNPNLGNFQDTNEIQVTSVFSTMTWWRQHRSEDFALLHDESSAFMKQRDLWQVMMTTHSPYFVNPLENHTTIVRLARKGGDQSPLERQTYRTEEVTFDEEMKKNLQALQQMDVGFSEVFFGSYPILVEGDTEHAAFIAAVVETNHELADRAAVIRARGKGILPGLIRMLRHFQIPFGIVHDIDWPYTSKGGGSAMWTINKSIYDEIEQCRSDGVTVRHRCSVPDFERALGGEELGKDKPLEAYLRIKADPDQPRFPNSSSICSAMSPRLPPAFNQYFGSNR